MSDIDYADTKGWTPVMFASYLGHCSLVELLLKHGANPKKTNFTGQNALELASFKSHSSTINLLNASFSDTYPRRSHFDEKQFFDDSPLVRKSDVRTNELWLSSALQQRNCQFLILHKLRPMVVEFTKRHLRLRLFNLKDVHQIILSRMQNLIFLGVEGGNGGEDPAVPWFAVDASDCEESTLSDLDGTAYFLNPFPGALQMHSKEAAIFSQARSLCDWHTR